MITVEEFDAKHKLYNDNVDDWIFFQLAYEGGRKFVESVLAKHPRESDANYKQRVKDGIVFNYARGVINIYSFYLTEQHPVREIGALENDPLFKLFEDDCDLNGTNFETFINENQKLASVFGAVGILVDKPPIPKGRNNTKEDSLRDKIYPYCATYTLPNILDWKITRDRKTGRPTLVYLKLREENDDVTIWKPRRWERYSKNQENKTVTMVDSGEVEIGEIPFVWFQNLKSITQPQIGISDITEISRITASIVRDISCGDEIIKYAGFPMLRKPMRGPGETGPDISGVTAVLEFDPDKGSDAKPDWLEAPTKEPIEAVTDWINKKISEIFEAAHLSGVHAHERSDQVRSGVAMRYEFQQLTRVLATKAANMNEAEMSIIRLFAKWQGHENNSTDLFVSRPADFSVDDLSAVLENLDIAKDIVRSVTFYKQLQKTIVRKTISDTNTTTLNEIYTEIDSNTTELPSPDIEHKPVN